jgi:hypothetical protein
MPSPAPVIATLVILVLALVLTPLIRRARAKRVSSFQSTVMDKRKETTMIYAGVFIPIVIYHVRVENGIEIRVSHAEYRSLRIGDTVLVSQYSDGSYRLDR